MSRCFPYPPPGYTLSKAGDEALIESIKLQKEKEKAREQRKKEKRREKEEKRREKKEKRKQKKEKRKEKKDGTDKNLDSSGVGTGHISKKVNPSETKVDFHHKRIGAEELERSSLTVENGLPFGVHARSTSSDSTENSNKRKRQSSSVDGSRGHGNVILVRLPSKKLKDFDTSAKEQHPCSTSGRIESSVQNKDDISLRDEPKSCTLAETRNIGQDSTHRTDRQQVCSTSAQVEAIAQGKSKSGRRHKMGLQYNNLIQNWAPPQLQASCLPDDLDWLLHDQDIRAEKRQRCGNDSISSSRDPALWPRAEYLHHVDIYALPFTVPL